MRLHRVCADVARESSRDAMPDIDPYRVQASEDLDRLIHVRVMGETSSECPSYSADEKAARRVLARLKATSGRTVVIGRTAMRHRQWVARYETDPSDGTEVLAETLPLAICRLALLRASADHSG